jgi:hypothetical protein
MHWILEPGRAALPRRHWPLYLGGAATPPYQVTGQRTNTGFGVDADLARDNNGFAPMAQVPISDNDEMRPA